MTRSLHFIAIVVLAGGFAALRFLDAQPAPVSAAPQIAGSVAPIGVLQSAPSLNAAQINAVLSGYGSPAVGSGQDFYDLGVTYGIDPAYALAFFVHESSAGTNPSWDGMKPDGSTTHDIGNISCAGYATCYGRWRDYANWRTGIDDWYRLISVEYIGGRGFSTVDQVIPVYAPSFENDVGGYTNAVSALVGQWRERYGQQPTHAGTKCPYTTTMQIAEGSSFYSTGSPYWGGQYGAMHLGDDFVGSPGDPVLAPFDLTVEMVGRYDDPGRYGQYIQARFQDGTLFYAGHLIDVYVSGGQQIAACTTIGTLGATAGPHVHIKLGAPGAPVPCEGSVPGPGGCLDPIEYWETH
jgi:hypothetical protein